MSHSCRYACRYVAVQFVEHVGVDAPLVTLGWEVMPEGPHVGDTITLRHKPWRGAEASPDLAATVLGREWVYGPLPAAMFLPSDWRSPAWYLQLWVHTGDHDVLVVEAEST